ncbi:MAG: hypothetical protein M1816_000371 [Peltula sp. TS41687]|nr:MAG: hypothetical protein M1816_000371 [Peltula sp. TS41687]
MAPSRGCSQGLGRSILFFQIPRSSYRSTYYRLISTLPKLPIFEAITDHDPNSAAVIHPTSGYRFTYGRLFTDAAKAKERIQNLNRAGQRVEGQRIAFLVENGYDYVVTLLSILGAHAIAVPLSPGFPASELRYVLNDSSATVLLSSDQLRKKVDEICEEGLDQRPVVDVVKDMIVDSPRVESKPVLEAHAGMGQGGMMLYTSGTTSRPKGVLLPQAALTAQCQSLVEAWKYGPEDHLLHVLPLHHIHGVINALLSPLFSGSSIEFMFPFNPTSVWKRLAAPFLKHNGDHQRIQEKISIFTAVPTIYSRLLSTFHELPASVQEAGGEAISPRNLRLTMSGSAALPSPIKTAWAELSQCNVLLERYGMTEVGMALSCGLDFQERVDGSVGWPLPSVQARLVDTESNEVIKAGHEVDENGQEREGEIQLRGPTLFKEYWDNAQATEAAFVPNHDHDDGGGKWFKTGDIAIRKKLSGLPTGNQTWTEGGMYFIRGRNSVDIIKTGGEKVSALEVERELLSLPQYSEAAVVALPSETWGQKVAAVVVLQPGYAQGKRSWSKMDMRRALKDMRRALEDRLSNYKIPRELKVVTELPKNAMGKVNKKRLVEMYFGDRLE